MPKGLKGRDVLILLGNGASPEVYTAIAGLREATITINNEGIDVTANEDNGYRELLEGRNVLSISVAGSGVFRDDIAFSTVRGYSLAGTHANYEIQVPGTNGGSYFATCRIAVEESGTFDDAVTFSITLESTGVVTFV